MEFSGQEYWSGLSFPPPGDLPDPKIKPTPLASPALAGRFVFVVAISFFFFFNFLFCTGEWSVNSVVIVSGEQQRDSAMHIHVSILPQAGRFFTTLLPGKPLPLLLVNVK